MTRQHATPPTSWPPGLAGTESPEPLDRAIEELVKDDQWIEDFIERLKYAIEDVVREKR
jgi:hypothetical protein